jgi:hypothetical protein
MQANLLDQGAIAAPGSVAAAVAWRWQGQLYLSLIAKATFAFAPDAAMTFAEPQPIVGGEVHHGKNPGRSIRFTTDLVPVLARTDVLFTGSAHAPAGLGGRALPVRLAVYTDQRTLLDKHLLVQDPAGFQRLPIVYERALRGPDGLENPFGVAEGGSPPQVVDPANPRSPAGFGPIARSWPARRRLLGTTPRKALDGPIAELPDDFDWAYFQAAPPDQQTEILTGDEWILLEGLHPDAPLFRTRLPSVRAMARIHGLSAAGIEEGSQLDLRIEALHIDGDEQRCSLVWRANIPLAGEHVLAAIRVATAVEAGGAPAAWRAPGGLVRGPDDASRNNGPGRAPGAETVALLPGEVIGNLGASTPFRPASPAAGAPSSTAALPGAHAAPALSTGTLSLDASSTLALDPGGPSPVIAAPVLPFGTLAVAPPSEAPAALPFRPATEAPAIAAPREAAPRPHVETGTLVFLADDPPRPPSAAPLPFAAPLAPYPIEDEPTLHVDSPGAIVEISAARSPEPEPIEILEIEPEPEPIVTAAPTPAPAPIAADAPMTSPWAPPPPAAPAPPPAPPRELPTPPRPTPALARSLYSRFDRKS